MRYKKELYEKEQTKIVDEILEILSLKENKITLYELENDLEKQEKIINLIPKIRKYYSFNNIKAVGEPEKIKRTWLSIIKQLIKERLNLFKKSYRLKTKNKVIKTVLYEFI